jgi:Family of unknown function (DUF6188)
MAMQVEHQAAMSRWRLPFQEEKVIWCCIDYAVSFGTQNQVAVRIEQPFVYTGADRVEHLIVPEADPVLIAPVLAITRLSVREGFAYDDGHLEVTFSDGSEIGVPSAQDYEPWELTGPSGLKMVSVPGGELSVWRPTAGSP